MSISGRFVFAKAWNHRIGCHTVFPVGAVPLDTDGKRKRKNGCPALLFRLCAENDSGPLHKGTIGTFGKRYDFIGSAETNGTHGK